MGVTVALAASPASAPWVSPNAFLGEVIRCRAKDPAGIAVALPRLPAGVPSYTGIIASVGMQQVG